MGVFTPRAFTPKASRALGLVLPTTMAGCSTICVNSRELELGCSSTAMSPLFSDEWLGTEVWPAAASLVALLQMEPWHRRIQGAAVIELGAGTGAVGLAAASMGAQSVLLTDKPSLVGVLRANVDRNGLAETCTCESLLWTTSGDPVLQNHPRGPHLMVLMSDCLNPVYGDEHAEALAATLHALLAAAASDSAAASGAGDHNGPLGLLAQVQRGEGTAESIFFASCGRLGLDSRLLKEEVGEHTCRIYSIRLSHAGSQNA